METIENFFFCRFEGDFRTPKAYKHHYSFCDDSISKEACEEALEMMEGVDIFNISDDIIDCGDGCCHFEAVYRNNGERQSIELVRNLPMIPFGTDEDED